MPRYYLHVANRVGSSQDEEGTELDDLAAAVEEAKQGIRSIISDEAKNGRIDFNGRVEIADAAGTILKVVPFPHAFEVVQPGDRAFPKE